VLVFQIWDADQSGLVVRESVSALAVYRTSVYSLLKCIEYLMYLT
jgi:hypothetical protein